MIHDADLTAPGGGRPPLPPLPAQPPVEQIDHQLWRVQLADGWLWLGQANGVAVAAITDTPNAVIKVIGYIPARSGCRGAALLDSQGHRVMWREEPFTILG